MQLSGDMIIGQAKKFHEQLNVEGECTYSSGWLHRFKMRNDISEATACGEARSADHEVLRLMLTHLPN